MKFADWLDSNGLGVVSWEPHPEYDFWGNERTIFEAVPLSPDEVEVILERYLRNVRKLYGDQPAARPLRADACDPNPENGGTEE